MIPICSDCGEWNCVLSQSTNDNKLRCPKHQKIHLEAQDE